MGYGLDKIIKGGQKSTAHPIDNAEYLLLSATNSDQSQQTHGQQTDSARLRNCGSRGCSRSGTWVNTANSGNHELSRCAHGINTAACSCKQSPGSVAKYQRVSTEPVILTGKVAPVAWINRISIQFSGSYQRIILGSVSTPVIDYVCPLKQLPSGFIGSKHTDSNTTVIRIGCSLITMPVLAIHDDGAVSLIFPAKH